MTTVWAGLGDSEESPNLPTTFKEFFECEYKQLTRFVESLDRNVSDSEDTAVEAMIKTFEKWNVIESPRPYVYKIARRLVYRKWRRLSRESRAYAKYERSLTQSYDPIAEMVYSSEAMNIAKELTERQRQAVFLRFLGFEYSEIAQIMNRSNVNVRQAVREAKNKLNSTRIKGGEQ